MLENCFGTNRKYDDPHCETINNIDRALSKPTCQIKNKMKRKNPEKSKQMTTMQAITLVAIHTLALKVFLDARVMENWNKM